MSKAQEKRDEQAARVAWNVKAAADYGAARGLDAAFAAFDEATDLFEAAGATDEARTAREERMTNAAYDQGEIAGRADALVNRTAEEGDLIEDAIFRIKYLGLDGALSALDVLENLRDSIRQAA